MPVPPPASDAPFYDPDHFQPQDSVGYLMRKVLISRLLEQGLLPLIIATIGLALLIRYSLQQFWTPLGLNFPPVFPRFSINVGGVVLPFPVIKLIDLAVVGLGLVA